MTTMTTTTRLLDAKGTKSFINGQVLVSSGLETFDAIYLRPFQFKESDPKLRRRGIQYISLPQFTWRKLREQFPEKYENEVTSSPDPDAWIKMKVVINGSVISVFIDYGKVPVLVVNKLTSTKNGKIGFYTGDTSGGDFANLRVTKK